MKRFAVALLACAFVAASLASPVLAAGPSVSKSVLGSDDEIAVIVVRIAASDRDIYGITIEDESGSIEDIVSPIGWSGVAGSELVAFGTVDRPIKAGSAKSFRIVTTNKDASFTIRFRDKNSRFGTKKTI
ncbi:MAG: hypothetical protein GTO51_06205 [Candidatus Latescibacteria bacterium]|nr:hypothetical protein [Candidatus Latescibacterota bacterium]NIM21383.1 hypothetical protein [Candidatus Latescibacterota bacterium]NIM65564.1 hypothetical protein [Candidatus Latescibacterota bacterium]NIO01944.1 hypothetical protein [Candidatus Latescibacterota bacterium]NIO28757.1 hypothetical protein [Candidatus Latescibacterota bacterium]